MKTIFKRTFDTQKKLREESCLYSMTGWRLRILKNGIDNASDISKNELYENKKINN